MVCSDNSFVFLPVTDLFFLIRSFIGYSNANYALSEVRNPVRTIKLAAPLAMLLVTSMYFLVNIAYYSVVDKQAILDSGQIAAALFFGRLWGISAERVSLSDDWKHTGLLTKDLS